MSLVPQFPGMLRGARLLVTRPRAQADDWVQRLQAHGLDAVALPLIEIAPAADAAVVRDAWHRLAACSLVVFVSPNAVEQFFALRPAQATWPQGLFAATPGPGTDAALREAGVPAALRIAPSEDAPQFDSESLWARLKLRSWAGERVLIVRGDGGREWLAERFRESGAEVAFVSAYQRRVPSLDAHGEALLRSSIERPAEHWWFFSSSEAIDHLKALCADRGLEPRWEQAQALATHPRIAERARRLGCGRVEELPPSIDGVLKALGDDGPSSDGYIGRSPEGMTLAGLGAARRSARWTPPCNLSRPVVDRYNRPP